MDETTPSHKTTGTADAPPHRLASLLPHSAVAELPLRAPDAATPARGGFPDLDDLAVQTYRHTLLGPTTVDDVVRACRVSTTEAISAFSRLRMLRAVRPGPTPGSYVAVSPSQAEMEVITPLEQAIQEDCRTLAELRSRMDALSRAFEDVQQSGRGLSGVFRCDVDETALWLKRAASQTESELLMLQPAESAEEPPLADDVPLQLGVLERGCQVRLIRHHTARTHSACRAGLNELTARGAEMRTTTELVERLIVFDRRIAFVRHVDAPLDGAATAGPGAMVVTDASMVALLRQVFEQAWRSAMPYDPAASAEDQPLEEVRAAILELLASGVKDEVIARRLGMSPRTCRRHIAGLMEQLNATSRFQAGLAAAQRGLLNPYSDPVATG